MEWIPLEPLDLPGSAAATINRRIATHLKFRTTIDNGEAKSNGFVDFKSKEAAQLEALRRELFIRRDICLLMRIRAMNTDSADAAMTAVRAQLTELEGK